MGLITKEVEVTITTNTIKYYEEKGYNIPKRKSIDKSKRHKDGYVYDIGGKMTVKTEDVPHSSKCEVDVLCDYCKEEIIHTTLCSYYLSIKNNGKFAGPKCINIKKEQTCMEKYGVKHIFESPEVQEKIKNTFNSKSKEEIEEIV